MTNVVAEYSLFTLIISLPQYDLCTTVLSYATWAYSLLVYELSWVTHCRGLWQGASLELHAFLTLHLHNSESTDHPRPPWSPAPSIQVNYRVG
jgi:hypothetical protein